MTKYSFFTIIVLFLLSCKKDSVVPASPITPPTPVAVFTLTNSSGNCLNASVEGNYAEGVLLGNANRVILQVTVISKGTYSIATGILNNYRFAGSGTFTDTGFHSIILQSSGTPGIAAVNTFPVSSGISSCSFKVTVSDPPPASDDDHMYFGNPSNAAAQLDSSGNYLLRKPYYDLSYSRDRGTPNWVSWHLFADDLGTVSRQDDFRSDNSIPLGWYQVQTSSYLSSGFDRGHNIPSADRTRTVDANSSTFLMTNMIPQAPNHNQLTWARLEDSLRRLATLGSEVYIVMGSYGVGGTGSSGFMTTIDAGMVTVPSNIWKIALVLPNGNNDSSRVTINTRVIAVDIPNINTVNGNWKNYRVTVDAIESATGYDFFKRLPVSLQAVLESRIDNL